MVESIADSPAFRYPDRLLDGHRLRLSDREERLERIVQKKRERAENCLQTLGGRLAALNPLSVLSRGYAAVKTEKGVVTRAEQIKMGDCLKIRFTDGTVTAVTESIEGGD